MARGKRNTAEKTGRASVSAQDEGRQKAANAKAEFKRNTAVENEYYECDERKLRKIVVVSKNGVVMRKYSTLVGMMKDAKTKQFVKDLKKKSPDLLKIA